MFVRSKPFFLLSILTIWLAFNTFIGEAKALEVPALRQPVTDLAHMIDQDSLVTLNNVLHRLHQRKIAQIAILTVPSLEGEALENYTIQVVDKWKLGSKKEDRGLLIFLSKKERKVRIEVGQRLEGDMTDVMSKRIIDQMSPYFKKGQFGYGLRVGLGSILKVLKVDQSKVLKSNKPPRRKKKSSWVSIIFLFIIIFLFRKNPFLLLMLLSGGRGGRGGGGFGGGGFGGGGGGFSGGGASGDW